MDPPPDLRPRLYTLADEIDTVHTRLSRLPLLENSDLTELEMRSAAYVLSSLYGAF